MADGVQTLENRIKRLEQLLQAHDAPARVVKIDYTGVPGAVEAQFDAVAREHGFENHQEMAELAGTQFVSAKLSWMKGRRVGIVTPKQAEAFLAGTWVPYGDQEPPEPYPTDIRTQSSTESLALSPQGKPGAGPCSHTKGKSE